MWSDRPVRLVPFILECMAQRRGSMTGGFRCPVISAVPLCAVALAAALTGCTPAAGKPTRLEGQEQRTPARVALPVPRPVAVEQIVIIGDSLSTGYGTSRKEAWPRLLQDDLSSAEMPVVVTNAARNGAGYIAVGDDEATFESEIDGTVNASTDVVVLFGSDNDAGQDPVELHEYLVNALAKIKTLAPHARCVIIGPLTGFDTLESDVSAIRDQERAAALDVGAEFVDPVAEHWIPGPDSALLGPDGEHPSSEGQHFLEGKIKALLTAPQGSGV